MIDVQPLTVADYSTVLTLTAAAAGHFLPPSRPVSYIHTKTDDRHTELTALLLFQSEAGSKYIKTKIRLVLFDTYDT